MPTDTRRTAPQMVLPIPLLRANNSEHLFSCQENNRGELPMTKSREDHNPGRRKFLKGVGIAGAGAAIADHLWTDAEAQEKQPTSLSGNVKITLNVNGKSREVQVEPRTTLLNALRNHL